MKDSLKKILLIAGLLLICFGLYTVYSTDTIIDAGPIQVQANDNSFDTESIVLIGLGVVAILVALFYKKK